ncbi:lysozyme [Melioribacter sp. Ez-97]|uniref:lysozyme n=1 Tax=Melioribacter sp. Ez-97 TaxID=3423434 RepID=UPI003ED867EB
MRASENCYKLIKGFETLHDGDLTLIGLQPKMCPAGIWTEGYGHAILYNGKPLKGEENKELAYKLSTVKTEAEAEELLKKDVEVFEKGVNNLLKVNVNQNQFDALVDIAFNIGLGALRDSTLLKKINMGDFKGAAEEFLKWNKSGGKVLPGLTRRRMAEKALFETPVHDVWIAEEHIPEPKGFEILRGIK